MSLLAELGLDWDLPPYPPVEDYYDRVFEQSFNFSLEPRFFTMKNSIFEP
jgi:hypothetical protein